MELITHWMHQVSFGIGLIGCFILIYGVTIGVVRWIRAEIPLRARESLQSRREALRHELAYYLLVSLEFLIASDIIDTIVQPGLEELAILGGVLAIRTVISFSLNWELRSGA